MLAVIGMAIYPVINLIVIMALDLTGKNAIGTAAGFIGLLGYLGRWAQNRSLGRMLDHFTQAYDRPTAWALVIWTIIGCTVTAMVLLAFTWRLKPRA
jgi:OPA family glycerol-3-phosphate transporter-like MFS transporter